ncbi:DUF2267 domain-containing protein [Candidatus Odyssella thessalonicensis]|uniref:DUF2267 domain-containing protein n=1 Tax=Candidatus Odyssella thessalonicensis TaxID=84647 RepID=UPI000225BF7F|nr:DUF2267 domain-containing protein [Candidatus Odyssella thessalonicensis]
MFRDPTIEKNFHKALSWLYDVEDACGIDEEHPRQALAALRSVLHQLRDLLPLENAAYLSAQFPIFIRGLFFENWCPKNEPSRIRKKQEFLEAVAQTLQDYGYEVQDIESLTTGVLSVIFRRIDPYEREKILKMVAQDLQELFY